MVVMVVRVRAWFYLSIQWRVMGRYLSLKNILQASVDVLRENVKTVAHNIA